MLFYFEAALYSALVSIRIFHFFA